MEALVVEINWLKKVNVIVIYVIMLAILADGPILLPYGSFVLLVQKAQLPTGYQNKDEHIYGIIVV